MKKMPRFVRYSLISLVLGAVGVVGCGSDDDDGSSGGNNGTGGSGIDTGSGGDGGSGRIRDGGSVDLTDQQVSDILNAQCTGWSGEGENLPAILQLVVDVSGSMDEDAPGSNNESKWDVTREALENAIAGLPPSVAVGLLLYPNQNTQRNSSPGDTEDCVNTDEMISIAQLGEAGSDHRGSLADAFADANVRAFTPTHDAYTYALENSLLPYQANASKFMLIITDGAPTLSFGCVDPNPGTNGVEDAPTQPIIDDIEAAFEDHGIRTFLIGSPGSEESTESGTDMRPWLSEAALLGGTASSDCDEDGPNFCHMDMTQEPDFAEALSEGLASIAGQIIDSCTFAFPDPPEGETIDPTLTNVIITWGDGQSTLILGDDVGDCTVGWQAGGTEELTLCPETCDAVKADGGARLHLAFGCGEDLVVR